MGTWTIPLKRVPSLRGPIRVPEDPPSSPSKGNGEDEAPDEAPDKAPGRTLDEAGDETPETTPEASGSSSPSDAEWSAPKEPEEEAVGADAPGGAAGEEEVPLRHRVPWWSPIGADTSDVERPDPKDVDVRTPLLLFLAPIVILAIGSLVARDLVWDRFLHPFVWEPIVFDTGFTIVNTALWALLLGLLLFLSFRLVQKVEQPVDMHLIFAVLPYMLGGAIVRVMEDTGYFGEPLRYLFVTPLIYVMIFGVAVLWLLIGYALRRQSQAVGKEAAMRSTIGLFGVIWVLYFAWTTFGGQETVSVFGSPWVLLFAFIVPLAYFWFYTRQSESFSQLGVMAAFGAAFMLFALYMLVLWHSGAQWASVADCSVKPAPCRDGFGDSPNLWVYPLMIGISGLFVGLIYWFSRINVGKWDNIFVFLLPINLLVIFGQTWDALSTSIGIDYLGYDEKHWLPGLLIDALEGSGAPVLADNAASFVMIPLKILVAFAVVWLIDVYSRTDMEKHPSLVGLVKLAIIMVGLVPGTRNAIRMAMGV